MGQAKDKLMHNFLHLPAGLRLKAAGVSLFFIVLGVTIGGWLA